MKKKTLILFISFILGSLFFVMCTSLSIKDSIPEEYDDDSMPLMFTDWKPDGWEATPEAFERIAGGTIAVLPFAGGNGEDGETIAELFSFDQTINQVFTPMPRTSITSAIRQERRFQLGAGMTDPDSVIALGKEIGARYIIAGNIAKLGDKNLLVISILNTETLEQIAGDIQTYQDIEEVAEKLPGMARNIARATRRNISNLPKLAIVPFTFTGADDARDVLAQILAINILRNGKYAVYPRTVSLTQIQQEWKNQLSGDTADEHISRIGAGENPRYVLSGATRRLGSRTMFNASIIDLESGAQVKGDSANYETLNDGIEVMEFLSAKLSDTLMTVSSFEDFIAAVDLINNSGAGSYFIIVNKDLFAPHAIDGQKVIFYDQSISFTPNAVKTITILGEDAERRIRYACTRYPFLIVPQGITLILGNRLTINPMVSPSTANIVWVEGGTFELRDNVILKNSLSAVVVKNGGTFHMKGGTITENGGVNGVGVLIYHGKFYMSGGTISKNEAQVNYDGYPTGAGVKVMGGVFRMSGGIITDNIAEGGAGAGVALYWNSIFIKTGGIISGSNSAQWSNVVYDGHNVRHRSYEAGLGDNMDSRLEGLAGGWE